jgi:hypothetical protein
MATDSWFSIRCRNQHRPSPGDLSRGYATYLTEPPSVDQGSEVKLFTRTGAVGATRGHPQVAHRYRSLSPTSAVKFTSNRH